MKKEECGGTASECEKEVDLFWKASQKYGGGRYKKNAVFELPKEVGWKPVVNSALQYIKHSCVFLQGMYTTSSTDLQAEQIPKNDT